MLFSVLFGVVGIVFGYSLNNHLPWTLLQISGVLLLGYSVFLPNPNNGLSISLLSIAVIYGIAKLFEWGDGFVFELTQHSISGHTLKHIVASFVGIPVIFAIKKIKKWLSLNCFFIKKFIKPTFFKINSFDEFSVFHEISDALVVVCSLLTLSRGIGCYCVLLYWFSKLLLFFCFFVFMYSSKSNTRDVFVVFSPICSRCCLANCCHTLNDT